MENAEVKEGAIGMPAVGETSSPPDMPSPEVEPTASESGQLDEATGLLPGEEVSGGEEVVGTVGEGVGSESLSGEGEGEARDNIGTEGVGDGAPSPEAGDSQEGDGGDGGGAQESVEPGPGPGLEQSRAFVDQMDDFFRNAPAQEHQIHSSAQPSQAQAPVEEQVPQYVTEEQADELLTDPAKLNDILHRVVVDARGNAVEMAREEALRQQASLEMQQEAARIYADNPQMNTPAVQQKCQQVVQLVMKRKPDMHWRDAFKYTTQYVLARMQTHPHEFAAGNVSGLPPLPGAAPVAAAPAAAPASPAPPIASRPAFAGGGGAARRTVPQKKKIDAFREELDALGPEHAWGG